MQVTLHQSEASDVERIAELRAIVLYDDLNRLGRYDEVRVRQRLRDSFDPGHTWLIRTEESDFIGCIAFKPKGEGFLLEHFYIHPDYQGRGAGRKLLQHFLNQKQVQGKTVTLNVLQGSPARRLYERFGFQVDSEDDVDVFMSAIAGTPAIEGMV